MRAIRLICLVALATTACKESASVEENWTYIMSVAPWIRNMADHCEAYKAEKKQANKNDLFTQAINSLTTVSVKDAQGEVDKVLPIGSPKDPDQYALMIKVRDIVTFTSDSKERPIPRSSDVYLAASKLKAGDCVIFSGEKIGAAGRWEQGKLCDTRYFMKFTSVKPCQ